MSFAGGHYDADFVRVLLGGVFPGFLGALAAGLGIAKTIGGLFGKKKKPVAQGIEEAPYIFRALMNTPGVQSPEQYGPLRRRKRRGASGTMRALLGLGPDTESEEY